jgi:hypothetical protein
VTPRLSVVVVGYNMARELPRTIRSLSPAMQRGIAAADYEVILVDNGSTIPFDEGACRRWIPELTIHHIADPTPSPARAVNKGLALARGELIGVLVDGARMASPGLLATALTASQLHHRPVIGTINFHLGPDVQMKSVRAGYNQQVENDLLRKSGWEEDGYRLFDIAVFAGSSQRGWFALPGECNALFLTAPLWREHGGYDLQFISPGGGLVNQDAWLRACYLLDACVIMLLGETTFHQVHGGIATNIMESTAPFGAEYQRIRGQPYRRPTGSPLFVGRLDPHALASMKKSLELLEQETPNLPGVPG